MTMAINVPVSWRDCTHQRPTVVALVVTPDQEVLMVLPSKASPKGWILPQGGIRQRETADQAALRELEEEFNLRGCFSEVTFDLGLHTHVTERNGGEIKQLVGVGLRMTRWQRPNLKGRPENRSWLLASGPNCFWSHIGGCTRSKQVAMAGFLCAAIKQRLLKTGRWQPARLAPMLECVIGGIPQSGHVL